MDPRSFAPWAGMPLTRPPHTPQVQGRDKKIKCLWRQMGVQIPAPPGRSSGLRPAPPDLEGPLPLKKGAVPPLQGQGRGRRGRHRCLPPTGAPPQSVSCHPSPLSVPGQPLLEAEGPQEPTRSVPHPQSQPGLAWDVVSSGSEKGHPPVHLPCAPSPPAPLLRGSWEPSGHSPWPF